MPIVIYRSTRLRDGVYGHPDSVLRRWLKRPYHIDGFRLDAANTLARQGEVQLGHKIGRQIRRALKADAPELYLLGEHSFDGTPHLQGDELDACTNFQGFSIPLQRFLSGHDLR